MLLTCLLKPDQEIELPYLKELICREEDTRQWVEFNSGRRTAVPARMLLELLKLTWQSSKNYQKINSPVLLLTAGQEKIVDNQLSFQIFKKLASELKQKSHFPQSYHDLMLDPVVDQVAEEISQFIASHSSTNT